MDDRISGTLQKSVANRWFSCVAASAFLAMLFCIGWLSLAISNAVQSFVVSGPSMAPTLWGPSRQFTCETCGWHTRVAEVGFQSPAPPLCFRCGQREGNRLSEPMIGDVVQLQRYAYWISEPNTDDLVAIKKPEGGLQVKRVVGRPGDLVRIDENGQVFVNERIWRPPFLGPELDDARPGVEVYQHAQELDSASRLIRVNDWIFYQHRDIHNRGLPDVIRDDHPMNLRLRRLTLPVEHLFVLIKLKSPSDIRRDPPASNGFRLEIACMLGAEPMFARFQLTNIEQPILIEFDRGTWNLLSADGQQVTGGEDQATSQRELLEMGLAPERPLALRFTGITPTEFETFWLGRGVRFDPPRDRKQAWLKGVRVAADRYVVMGDNSAASEDSRHDLEGVERNQIVGKVSGPQTTPSFPAPTRSH